MAAHLLLMDCTDEKGLIHRVAEVLYHHGLNIDDQEEFVQKDANHFFMRTEFSGECDSERLLAELKPRVPADAQIRLADKRPKDLVVLVTKEPHCLGDLLIRNEFDELPGNILAVIGNHADLEDLVKRFGLPFHCCSHGDKSREQHEQELLEILDGYQPDYLVLAKYMRVLTAEIINRYTSRIINIHHSFLPAFAGAKPYHQAFMRGVKIIGATAHFVTEKLDQGPILAQDVINVDHSMTPADMMRAGRDVEKVVLANALTMVLEDRVFVHGNRTVIFS